MKILLLLLPLFIPYSHSPSSTNSPFLSDPLLKRQAGCSYVRVRKEWRQLSAEERTEFFRGFHLLKSARSLYGFGNRYDDFVYYHFVRADLIHNTPVFFPWHRAYLLLLEQEVRKLTGNPRWTLPYWQWTVDSQAPEQSPIFSDAAFGGNGDRNNGFCVRTGQFANWQRQFPSQSCLQRQFDGRGTNAGLLSALYSPVQMESIVHNAGTYDELRRLVEGNPHALVHGNIGGDMSTMQSPNDPLFFLHHAQIDRLWFYWQSLSPSTRFTSAYDGPGASVSDKMPIFGVPVSFVMDVRRFCYTYSTGVNPSRLIAKRSLQKTETEKSFTDRLKGMHVSLTKEIDAVLLMPTTVGVDYKEGATKKTKYENEVVDILVDEAEEYDGVEEVVMVDIKEERIDAKIPECCSIPYPEPTQTPIFPPFYATYSGYEEISRVSVDSFDRENKDYLRVAGRVTERVICEFGLDAREVQDVGTVLQLVNVLENLKVSRGLKERSGAALGNVYDC